MTLEVIILAAGAGTRMCSALPKVLHPLAGKPILAHIVDKARQLQANKIHIVYGHQAQAIKSAFVQDTDLNWVLQTEQLGTGHATKQVLSEISDNARVLILVGDVPLVPVAALQQLLSQTPDNGIGVLSAIVDDPKGLGRIKRDSNQAVLAIVEDKDTTPDERAICEINTGIITIMQPQLATWLDEINNDNAQQEYYLTDLIAVAVNHQQPVAAVVCDDPKAVGGINDRVQLAAQERHYQYLQACAFMRAGVSISDPRRFDARGDVSIAKDSQVDVNVILQDTAIGTNTTIAAHNVIKNATVGDNVIIKENCVIEDAIIEDGCVVGPFARLRPGTYLKQGAKVGNFVEIKQAQIGEQSKVNHLSYIGDAIVGCNVNIGAGGITCNYDGANKYQTIIEDDVFLGSAVQLIAPLTIGKGATIGAGSVITKDAPAGQLTLMRGTQKTVANWQRPVKKDKS